MPRVKGSPKKLAKTGNANTWIFLMKGESLESSKGVHPNMVKLRHPATNQAAMFVFSPGDSTIQEVMTFNENKRSWFIDDNVSSDGKMHLSTPIDPIFLILPYLKKSQQVMPLEQLIHDEDYPETIRLTKCQNLKLALVAERKGDESLQAYKYNEEKTLNWLQKKVEKVADVIKKKGLHVSQGAISANFVKTSKYEGGTETEYMKYSHGIVSEYLSEDLSKKLLQHLNLPDDNEHKKRKLTSPSKITNDDKRVKREKQLKEEQKEDTSKNGALDLSKAEKPAKPSAKTPPVSKKDLARQKAAAGSKSITSFFKKK